jgi:hypothetical protein
MSVQLSLAVRNARLNAIETAIGASAILEIYSGAVPASCAAATTGTALAQFALAAAWAAQAANGAMSLSSTPLTSSAIGNGNAGYFRIYASDGVTCHLQGSVTAAGSGGDMTVDNPSIVTGQIVTVSGFTLNEPNS